MSKGGGAGKVYFILYLAVLLELLIIIVERDDAEDELRKEKLALEAKRKQIQLIAETILNSLRGSATSVSSTSDQSMIIGDPNEKDGRNFNVRVRVADPTRDTVKDLDLHILRNKAEMTVLNIAKDSVKYPYRVDGHDYIYTYNFKPMYGQGEYTLHFDAKTNQIVGVSAQHSPDDTVKIGAVHLTVRELSEVKDGITENVTLRGYIDSLLTGLYENFATNIGSNEFVVNVKENPVDKVELTPEFSPMAAFSGIELWNRINVKKAPLTGPRGVTMVKVDGPGEIKQVDSIYYWVWKPDASTVGQSYTVHIKGEAHRGGGANDLATTDFPVVVNKLQKAVAAPYFPANKKNEATPYTRVTFKANEKIANLDGIYRTELYLAGNKVATREEPSIEYTPEFMKDEGKSLEVKAYFKSSFMKDFVVIDDQTFKIAPTPFVAVANNDGMTAGDALQIKAAYDTISGARYVEIGSDHLNVESDGYFDVTAKKEQGKGNQYFFDAKATGKVNTIKAKDGKLIDLTISDPITGQTHTTQITVYPKAQVKGRGPGGGGGGGIH
ncbi:MAG: hypothetical protein Q8922_11665 [Bacteroidota bacterium]|nr:hypothetical protein [Bacteroidota bacterium]MDP4234661.1 hypothetical protein [Bacteroidota bacterium]MDP4243826.1 hypothetical protein [Bacteroidota bacterium]MDP4288583.1 hypothetical protein [Bacteroidota bacterium]